MDVQAWLGTLSWTHNERSELVRRWRDTGRFQPVRAPDREAAGRILEDCRRQGVEVLPAPGLPASLYALHDPPAVLFLRGDPGVLTAPRRVAVIGARSGSGRGRRVAESLGVALAEAGAVVVSGLAEGVDGASHEGCLRAGGRPLGVLGTGVDRVYPGHHGPLHREVAGRGILVSEYPPGAGPRRHRFLARNRILAGLAEALVVVEAGARSGTLSTTDFALQLGREVLAVPGPVDDPVCEGTNRLLREGATLIRGAADLLDSLGLSHPEIAEAPGPRSPEEIARARGWSLTATLARITEWELEGRATRAGGGRWIVRD